MRRSLPLLALLLLALPGCGSTPSEVAGGPILFNGTLLKDGDVSYTFVVTKKGGARLEVTSLAADPPLDGILPSIGLGLGQLGGDGNCVLTYSASAREGFRISFGLKAEEYCLRVFDNGTLDDGASRIYELRVTASD
jgi:hypothetical protein